MRDSLISVTATVLCCEQGQFRIEVQRSSGCGGCAQKSVCSPVPTPRALVLDLPLAEPQESTVHSGQRVVLSIETGVFARMVVLCYLAPAVLMLIGASLGAAIWPSQPDFFALVGAGLGLMVGCALLRLYDSPISHAMPGK